MSDGAVKNHAAFIWSVADLLRGDYKQSEYGQVILPLVVLRRLDCVLEPTKDAVLERRRGAEGQGRQRRAGARAASRGTAVLQHVEARLPAAARRPGARRGQPARLHRRLLARGARDVIDEVRLRRPRSPGSTRRTCSTSCSAKFAEIDLHPDAVSNIEMGYLYEELIRRFSELSNETAGEHFTPREVIRLMVDLLFVEDDDALRRRRASCARSTTRPAAPAACSRSPRTTCAS